eukprot:5057321-Amphidinium_carterae.1
MSECARCVRICSADDLMSPLPIDTCGSSLEWLNSVARKHSAGVVVTAQTLTTSVCVALPCKTCCPGSTPWP